jgi:chromosomal replication initiation ATPase DnaA
MPQQYSLRFPDQPERFSDLAITSSNEIAIEAIRNWKSWSHPAMCLVGPVQSGLRVTARLWAAEAGADLLDARAFDELGEADVSSRSRNNCAIDLADSVVNEANLLSLLNFASQRDVRVLLTARAVPSQWPCKSADLRSRLDGLQNVKIYPPDEDMLIERLKAACRRRYMKLDRQTIAFLAIRLPRSYAAIEEYVSRLDEAVDANQRAPSIHLARTVLEDGAGSLALFGDPDDV